MNHQFNALEVISAAPDAVAMACGTQLARPHPLASVIGLRAIAHALGEQARKPQSYEHDLAIVARGIGTSDFSRLLASGVQNATIAAYTQQAEHNVFVAPLEVMDFMPSEIPALDADFSLEPLAEHGEIQKGYAFLTAGAQQVSLMTFGRAVNVSREIVINDRLHALAQIFTNLGTSAARLESRLVAAALEANPTLDDGAVVFHADNSNVVADGLASGLGAAIALLRTQPTAAGQRADLRAKNLVVAPDLELTARSLVIDSGLDMTVSVLANLPAARWYVMADQTVCPTIATLRLAGAKTPVRVEQKKRQMNFDGVAVKVVADLGATLLRRVGIVRGGA